MWSELLALCLLYVSSSQLAAPMSQMSNPPLSCFHCGRAECSRGDGVEMPMHIWMRFRGGQEKEDEDLQR